MAAPNNCRVHPRHCKGRFAVNEAFCVAGIERVLDRYALPKNEFFQNGLPLAMVQHIDNTLVQRAVKNAIAEQEKNNGNV